MDPQHVSDSSREERHKPGEIYESKLSRQKSQALAALAQDQQNQIDGEKDKLGQLEESGRSEWLLHHVAKLTNYGQLGNVESENVHQSQVFQIKTGVCHNC